jgi:ribonuclease HII
LKEKGILKPSHLKMTRFIGLSSRLIFLSGSIHPIMPRHERHFAPDNVQLIAGIDEAGRGPLAGPVVAAAVILPGGKHLPGIDDSKVLSPEKRNLLFDMIGNEAVAMGVGISCSEEIDRINILEATRIAALRALKQLRPKPHYVLTDALTLNNLSIPHRAIIKGDKRCRAIAAASIIAKVFRDRMMLSYHQDYPGYEFSKHKGYATKKHIEAIGELGPTTIHRLTFHGVCWFHQDLVHSSTFSQLNAKIARFRREGKAVDSLRYDLDRMKKYLPMREILALGKILTKEQ